MAKGEWLIWDSVGGPWLAIEIQTMQAHCSHTPLIGVGLVWVCALEHSMLLHI